MNKPMFIDTVPKAVPILGLLVEIRKAKIKEFGTWSIEDDAITLRWKLNDSQAKRTLIHEIFHAGLEYSGLSDKLNDHELEEALCKMTETLFYQLIDFKFEKK